MNYHFTLWYCNELGEDKFFKCFEQKFKNFQLYSMSLDWKNSKKYILKFKGKLGDLIVSWI